VDLSNRENSGQPDVLSLISEKLETLVTTADLNQISSKYKAITAFFPYAVWQSKTLDAFLLAVRTSKRHGFMWRCIRPLIATLLNKESHVSLKQAVILASPHLRWRDFPNSKELVKLLAAAASAIPYTEEVGMSVVDTLLQIASNDSLRSSIPLDMWSWLNERPSLPAACWGRYLGSRQNVVRSIRRLEDVETLKSFLLLVWSEWDGLYSEGLQEMSFSIQLELGKPEMWHHREDLLRHLDHILGQLDIGTEHLRQRDPDVNESDIQRRKDQYETLREVLLEVEMEATEILTRKPLRLAVPFHLLIPMDRHEVQLDIYVCNSSPVSIAAYPGYS